MELSLVGVQSVYSCCHSLVHSSAFPTSLCCSGVFPLSYFFFSYMDCLSCCSFHCKAAAHQEQHLMIQSCSLFLFVLPDLSFITTWPFLWKVSAITLISCLPLYIIKYLKRKFSPPSYSKLSSWSQSKAHEFLVYLSELSIFSTFLKLNDGPVEVGKPLRGNGEPVCLWHLEWLEKTEHIKKTIKRWNYWHKWRVMM